MDRRAHLRKARCAGGAGGTERGGAAREALTRSEEIKERSRPRRKGVDAEGRGDRGSARREHGARRAWALGSSPAPGSPRSSLGARRAWALGLTTTP
jgi:hypothetical protein